MATKTLVPVEEYLHMTFDGPAPDFVDGEIVERHLGSIPHFKAQRRLLEFFLSLEERFSLYGYPEVTLKISPRHYRIADVAVFVGKPVGKAYPSDPPAIVIEIVSEDDRHVDILKKLSEYQAWGIPHIWLADPWMEKLFVYGDSGLHEVSLYELPEFSARIGAPEIFAE